MSILGASHALKVYMTDDADYLHITQGATAKMTMVMKDASTNLEVGDISVHIPKLSADTITSSGNIVATSGTITSSGDIITSAGAITSSGDITTSSGNIVASAGAITSSGDITTSAGVFSGNLNGTKGQLLSFMGEVSGVLRPTSFDWCFGDGLNSSSVWGICVPMAVNIMRFSYQCHNGGTAFTNTGTTATSTVMVQQLWVNNSAKACYAFCDFSDTTNGSVAYYRFSNKVSSSPTSQVDIVGGFPISGGSGSEFSWKGYSQANFPAANTGHRLTTIAMTTEDI